MQLRPVKLLRRSRRVEQAVYRLARLTETGVMLHTTCDCGTRWVVRRTHDTCPACGKPSSWVIEEAPQHCRAPMLPRWYSDARCWVCRHCELRFWPDGTPAMRAEPQQAEPDEPVDPIAVARTDQVMRRAIARVERAQRRER